MSGETAVLEREEAAVADGDKKFDPSKYLITVKGGALHLEVKFRLLWLRREHPDAIIETELVKFSMDPAIAVFKATVTIPGGGSAVGWGSETAKDFGDWVEKSETKSLGRALKHLGYGTEFTDDDGDVVRPQQAQQNTGYQQRGSNYQQRGNSRY